MYSPRWWLTLSYSLQLGVGIIGAPERSRRRRRPTQGQLPPPWKPTSLPMCQEGWVILIKILYLPMNQQSLHHTMASGLLIDQKTFNKTQNQMELSPLPLRLRACESSCSTGITCVCSEVNVRTNLWYELESRWTLKWFENSFDKRLICSLMLAFAIFLSFVIVNWMCFGVD